MEKRQYILPQTKIARVEASEILVIIANSETDTQWAPRYYYDEDTAESEDNDDYGIGSYDNRKVNIWE